MYSSGPFCTIHITHNVREGVQVWAIRNPRYRVDGPGVLVNTITCQESFESDSIRRSPYIPTRDIRD